MPVPIFRAQGTILSLSSIYGSDLVAHFRADQGITLDGSNRVSAWRDLTNNGHDLDQPTASQRPEYSTTGAANGGQYVLSGTLGTNIFMQHLGTPVTVTTGSWTLFMIAMCATNPGAAAVFTTSVTRPALCADVAFRRNAANDIDFQQIGLSAPTAITVGTPDFAPPGTWIAATATMGSGGTRTLTVHGEGTSGSSVTGPHTTIGANLADGYIFRFAGTYYQSLCIQELAFIKRTTTTADLALVRAYARTRGVSS